MIRRWLRNLIWMMLMGITLPLAADELDPVVADVVRMLEAEVSVALVEEWLETGEHRPGELKADDLIALQKAGAPEDLVRRLLQLSAAAPPPAPPLPEAPPPGEPPPVSPDSAVAPPPSPTVVEPTVPSAPSEAKEEGRMQESRVRFDVQYAPAWGEGEEAWDLYVYVDGEILAWLPGQGGDLLGREDTLFERRLEPGSHEIRLLQERHTRRGDGWFHEARVFGEALPLKVPSGGAPLEVRLAFRQARFNPFSDPLKVTMDVLQAGLVEDTRSWQGEAPEDGWAPLCEDVEANGEPGKKLPRPLRPLLKRCVRWNTLWAEATAEREAVRAELERFEFRPVPINAQ